MQYVSGKIFKEDGIFKGYLGFDNKKIIEIGKTPPKKPKYKGLIIPSFINSHTHIGDSFVAEKDIKLPKDINKLVAPPNGIKHKLLEETSGRQIINGMRNSINNMIKNGVSTFIDYREGGSIGIKQLKIALNKKEINSIVLSRPTKIEYKKTEIDELLKNSDGIGLSSISDWDYSEIKKISDHAHKRKKIFSIHASERIREDIDLILDLKPDFLVHFNKAYDEDLTRVKENNIPIIICPRSNDFFDVPINFKKLIEHNITIMLGTDNVMLNSPSILDEIKFLKNKYPKITTRELIKISTYNPRKALNLKCDILSPNSIVDFIVLDEKNLNLIFNSIKNI